MNIAVIPARGGSKRIPRKNIKIFNQKPIIAWSIEAAKSSGLFNHIIVSTDDLEIAEVARQYGAEVPFMRPYDLSNDYATTAAVITHATKWALNEFVSLNAICCIYPAAPLIEVTDLKIGLEILGSGDWDYVFSATNFTSPIFRSFRQVDGGGLEMFFPEQFDTRSQDLPPALHDAAQFYWGRPDAWVNEHKIFGINSTPIILPRWRVQDIDVQEDWERVELIFKMMKGI